MGTFEYLRRSGLLLLAAGVSVASAQPFSEEAEQALPLYHVEVIVFANNEGNPSEEWFAHELAKSRRAAAEAVARPTPRIVGSGDSEFADGADTIVLDSLSLDELIFAPPDEPPEDPNALLEDVLPGTAQESGLGTTAGTLGAETAASDEIPNGTPADDLDVEVRYLAQGNRLRSFRFRRLDEDELQLGDEYARIERLSAYEPLVHGGWVQEGLAENEAHPFDLVYLGASNPRGTIQLHLSRFLHVTLDLDYFATSATLGGPRTGSFALGEIPSAPRYALETQRRLRSGELHYIDHPMFGVLVLVTPAPEPPETEADGALPQTPAA